MFTIFVLPESGAAACSEVTEPTFECPQHFPVDFYLMFPVIVFTPDLVRAIFTLVYLGLGVSRRTVGIFPVRFYINSVGSAVVTSSAVVCLGDTS